MKNTRLAFVLDLNTKALAEEELKMITSIGGCTDSVQNIAERVCVYMGLPEGSHYRKHVYSLMAHRKVRRVSAGPLNTRLSVCFEGFPEVRVGCLGILTQLINKLGDAVKSIDGDLRFAAWNGTDRVTYFAHGHSAAAMATSPKMDMEPDANTLLTMMENRRDEQIKLQRLTAPKKKTRSKTKSS